MSEKRRTRLPVLLLASASLCSCAFWGTSDDSVLLLRDGIVPSRRPLVCRDFVLLPTVGVFDEVLSIERSEHSAPLVRSAILDIRTAVSLPSANTVYAAAGDRLLLYDFSDPTSPSPVGQCPVPSGVVPVVVLGSAERVLVVLSSIEDSPTGRTLVVADVTDPADPRVLGSITGLNGTVVSASGSTVCYRDYQGLRLLDVSDPASPVEVGFLALEDTGGTQWAMSSDHLYAVKTDEIRIVDLGDPTSPHTDAAIQRSGPRSVSASLWTNVCTSSPMPVSAGEYSCST